MDIGFLFFIFDYGFWILDLLKGIMDFDVKLKVDVDWIEVGLTWYELDGVTKPKNPMWKKKKNEEDQTKPSMKGKRKKEKEDQRERKKKKKRRRRRRPPKLIEPSEKKKEKRKGQKLRLLLWP